MTDDLTDLFEAAFADTSKSNVYAGLELARLSFHFWMLVLDNKMAHAHVVELQTEHAAIWAERLAARYHLLGAVAKPPVSDKMDFYWIN